MMNQMMLTALTFLGAFVQSSCINLRGQMTMAQWVPSFLEVSDERNDDKWKFCVLHDTALRSPQPVFADVRPFINYPDQVRHREVTFTSEQQIGMALQEQPHDLGEVVKDVIPGSQAENAGVRKGWIITEIDGKPFSPQERLKDVADDFASAKKDGVTLTVKYDVRTYFDCTDGDCSHSDKFPTETMARCADACAVVSGCDWWSFGSQDGDNSCSLQSKGGSSLVKSTGTSSAPRSCAPQPAVSDSESWPQCITSNSHIYNDGSAVFTDVRSFISRRDDVQTRTITFKSGSVGMGITEGGVINEVLPDTQASRAGVREGWIIKELDGRPFNRGESLPLVGEDFDEAKNEAPGLIVKFDVMSTKDCTNGDCSYSDKLPVDSEAACAKVCSQVSSCQWWSVGTEDGDMMCWLRSSDKGLRSMEGSSTGRRGCQAPEGGLMSSLLWVGLVLGGVAYFNTEIRNRVQDLSILHSVKAVLSVEPSPAKISKYSGFESSADHKVELARVDALVL